MNVQGSANRFAISERDCGVVRRRDCKRGKERVVQPADRLIRAAVEGDCVRSGRERTVVDPVAAIVDVAAGRI